jgi:GMP synthase (glutamine-hydrolysing)
MVVYLLQHDAKDNPQRLVALLEARGLPWVCLPMWEAVAQLPDVQHVTAAVVLGGSMNADQDARFPFLTAEKHWIQAVAQAGRPLLGICLGGQLLARALGAPVHRHRRGEIGWTPLRLTEAGQADPVLAPMAEDARQGRVPQFQWHEDSFDWPPGALPLAGTEVCPQQAYRVARGVYGVQFHPEVTRETILDWVDSSKRLSLPEKTRILADTEACFPRASAASDALLRAFLNTAIENRSV